MNAVLNSRILKYYKRTKKLFFFLPFYPISTLKEKKLIKPELKFFAPMRFWIKIYFWLLSSKDTALNNISVTVKERQFKSEQYWLLMFEAYCFENCSNIRVDVNSSNYKNMQ